MSETILVTGACGFTGSNMLEYLRTEYPSDTIVATDLDGSERETYYTEPSSDGPKPVYYRDMLDRFSDEFIAADLTSADAVSRLADAHNYDRVFHIASLFDYFAHREVLHTVNVDGTGNLLSALKSQSPRLVHWSTLGVLGHAGFGSAKCESASYNPHNRYCESKVAQEKVVTSYHDSFDTTIIRPAPIYGPRHRYGVYHILTLLQKLGRVPVARIIPRSRQLQFPSVHVHDLVRAADELSKIETAIGESYNVTSNCIGQDELLQLLSELLSLKQVTVSVPYKFYKYFANALYPLAVYLEKFARLRDTRPLVDAPMVRYLTKNMWFSNEKVKDAGVSFKYDDPRNGLREYVSWCYRNDYL